VNVASILGKLWTLPNTALGLAVGAVAVILRAARQVGDHPGKHDPLRAGAGAGARLSAL
jgi:hypothetical protein